MPTAFNQINHGATEIKLERMQSAIVFDADGGKMTAYLPDANETDMMDISVAVVVAFAAQATPAMRVLWAAAYKSVAEDLYRFEAQGNAAAG